MRTLQLAASSPIDSAASFQKFAKGYSYGENYKVVADHGAIAFDVVDAVCSTHIKFAVDAVVACVTVGHYAVAVCAVVVYASIGHYAAVAVHAAYATVSYLAIPAVIAVVAVRAAHAAVSNLVVAVVTAAVAHATVIQFAVSTVAHSVTDAVYATSHLLAPDPGEIKNPKDGMKLILLLLDCPAAIGWFKFGVSERAACKGNLSVMSVKGIG